MSARTAWLLADGEIGIGDAWRNDSIAGTSFTAQPTRPARDRARPAVNDLAVPDAAGSGGD
jgi:proline racemase